MANLLSTGIYGFLCSVVKRSGQYVSNFVSGTSGWMIKHTGEAEFESIYARDKIVTNEFVYNRIRVTEDEEIVSSNGKILFSEENEDGNYTVSLDLREGDINPFAKNDLVIGYYHNPENSGLIYKKMMFTVKDDPGNDQVMTLIPEKKSVPYRYMIIVRVGNISNIDRQAFIMISSRTNAQYFHDGINSWEAYKNPENIKCFLGKVSDETSGIVPEWAKNALSGLKKFFLIADGVILRGTFILKGTGKNAGTYTDVESAITAVPGLIESKVNSVKIGGTNLMKCSACVSRTPVDNVDNNRPMAVNTEIYGTHRMNDGFARINGDGDYYWYVEPVDATTIPAQSGAESAMYNLWGGFTSSYESLGDKNFVAGYNDFYTISFDYYFEGVVGDIPLAARFYWGTTYPGTEDVTETVYELLNKTPGVWHHCELTVDLRKYKASIFESKKNIFFQLRTVSGWGQNYAGWKMFHKNIQLEKGNKASDWTPAPEDFYEASNKANQAANEAKQAIGYINKDMSELNDYIDGAFSDNIISEAEAVSIEKYINTVRNSESAVNATYTTLLTSNYLSGVKKSALRKAYADLSGTIENLVTSIYSAIKDRLTTLEEKKDVDNKFTLFNTALASFYTAVESANREIQDYFNNKYTSIKQTVDEISLTVKNTKAGGTNWIRNGDFSTFSVDNNVGWDNTLNGNLVAERWGTGYNSAVINPNAGYHAHLSIEKFGYPVIEFINKNMPYGESNRWLGFTQTINGFDKKITKGEEYTISMDVYTDTADAAVSFGLYLYNGNGNGEFVDGKYELLLKEKDKWMHVQQTFIAKDTYPERELYIYGHEGNEGRIWVKNVSVQKGNLGYWTPAKEDVEEEVNAAKELADHANTSANNALSSIERIIDDNIFSAAEKRQLKPEWESILNEKEGIDNNADIYGLYDLKRTYQTNYETLCNYMTPLMAKPDTDSPSDGASFNGDMFRDNFISFYNARNNLLNAVYAAAKQLSDRLTSKLLDTGINISDKKIMLTADKTIFRDNSGNDIALFENGMIKTEMINTKELSAGKLNALDSTGNIRSSINREDDGAFRTYYPDGTVQFEIVAKDDEVALRCFNSSGGVVWAIGNSGEIKKTAIDYWGEVSLFKTNEQGSNVITPGNLPGDKYSVFHAGTYSSDSNYEGLTVSGIINGTPPSSLAGSGITGWYTSAKSAGFGITEGPVNIRKEYSRVLFHYQNGYITNRKTIKWNPYI